MAPELRSNVAGPDTETSVQKGWSRQTNDPYAGERKTEIIRLTASSLRERHTQAASCDRSVHFKIIHFVSSHVLQSKEIGF